MPDGKLVILMKRAAGADDTVVCVSHCFRPAYARNRGGQLSVDTIERVCCALGITLSEFFACDGTTG